MVSGKDLVTHCTVRVTDHTVPGTVCDEKGINNSDKVYFQPSRVRTGTVPVPETGNYPTRGTRDPEVGKSTDISLGKEPRSPFTNTTRTEIQKVVSPCGPDVPREVEDSTLCESKVNLGQEILHSRLST